MATKRSHEEAAERVPAPDGYRLEDILGRGGMGAVYRVRDEESGRLLALKRLLLPPADDATSEAKRKLRGALFEREYHTLAQLAHPRVVEVFDYGVDAHGPYYTMELLEGSDLTALAPLPWKEACAIARDVASCLAIVHSRRLLHRDVSARNVHCTRDLRAKLLDFGAMSPMGVSEDVVGTPPYVPPEGLLRQPLDPRSDLYALGAVLYFALTGQHAYPTRTLRELPSLWKRKLAAPSEKVEGIPRALDQLVLSLLSPDPQARPLMAAEVIDRLESLAGLPAGDSVAVAQAYLKAPTLVAREPTLARFRSLLKRLHESRGSVLFVEAEGGLGRSRLLQAFSLEAKLAGAAVLQAGATQAAAGEFGMGRAWVEDLLRALSKSAAKAAAPYVDVLGHVFPTLHERRGRAALTTFESPAERTHRVGEALLSWLEVVSSRHRVVLLADDLQRADPESLALLVGLAQRAASLRLLLVVSAESGAASSFAEARRLIRETATLLSLSPLSGEETEQLLRSIFGEAPRLEILADWMQRQSAGNPRLCMELAGYLLERGHVRFQSGAWVLPEDPEGLEVPSAFEQMLAQRLATLSPDARLLAETRALVSQVAPLEVEEYALLLDGDDVAARTHAAFSELCGSGVLASTSAGYLVAQPGFMQVLEAELSEEDRRARHRRLAEVYDRRPVPPQLTAYHWVQGGEVARALTWLLSHSEAESEDIVGRENAAVVEAYEAALVEAKRQGRSPRAQMQLLNPLVVCASQVDAELMRYADELMEHLRRDTGLDLWQALDPAMDPGERTRAALAQARAEYERTPEAERGLSPSEAIATLRSAVQMLTSASARARELRPQRALAALFEPLASLSEAAAFTFELLSAAARRTGGREIGDKLRELVERAAQGVRGIDAGRLAYVRSTVGYYAAVDAYYQSMSDWVLALADTLERAPIFEVMAWQVRLHYHLARGNALEIASCRKRRDLAQARSPVTSQHAASGLQWELVMVGRYNDLMQLKSLLGPLDAEAARFPAWRPMAHQARGEYHFARSDWDAARRELEAALTLAAPGEFTRWPDVVARCLQTMVYQGETEAAYSRGRDALREAEQNELSWIHCVSLRLAVGLAQVAAGGRAAGLAAIRSVQREVDERGVLDLYAGSSETLARASLYADDPAIFAEALGRLAELVRPGQHPALLAKYERLAADGRRRFGVRDDPILADDGATALATSVVRATLHSAGSSRERIARSLALLTREAGARGGFLFGLRDQELVCLGSHDGSVPAPEIERGVRDYFSGAGTDMEMTKTLTSGAAVDLTSWLVDGRLYQPLPLTCEWKDQHCLAGVAVLEVDDEKTAPVPLVLSGALAEYLAKSGDTTPASWLDW